jgi:hypothetical protein
MSDGVAQVTSGDSRGPRGSRITSAVMVTLASSNAVSRRGTPTLADRVRPALEVRCCPEADRSITVKPV